MSIDTAVASASPAPEAAPDLQFVVALVGDERYGIEVSRVREIIRLPPITALPSAHPSVSGVINLRGRIIPVMDLRQRFHLEPMPATRLSRIVVADAHASQLGLVVDAVDEVVLIAAGAIEPTPVVAAGPDSAFMTGIARVADGLIVILDLDLLIGGDAGAWDVLPGVAAVAVETRAGGSSA